MEEEDNKTISDGTSSEKIFSSETNSSDHEVEEACEGVEDIQLEKTTTSHSLNTVGESCVHVILDMLTSAKDLSRLSRTCRDVYILVRNLPVRFNREYILFNPVRWSLKDMWYWSNLGICWELNGDALEGLSDTELSALRVLIKGKMDSKFVGKMAYVEFGWTSKLTNSNGLASSIRDSTSLQSLIMRRQGIDNDWLLEMEDAFSQNSSIKNLVLSSNHGLGTRGCGTMGKILRSNNSLKKLSLEECNITDEGYRCLGRALAVNACLEILSLSNNTSKQPANIAHFFLELKKNTGLRELNIDGNKYAGDMHPWENLAALIRVHPTLQHLNVTDTNLSQEGFTTICEAISANPILESFHCNNVEVSLEGEQHLANALKKKSCNLNVLSLRFAIADEYFGSVLMPSLSTNSSLTFLDVSSAGLASEVFISLALALKTNYTLRTLFANYNDFNDNVCQSFGEALQLNKGLQWLSLYNCHITPKGAEYIAKGLESNGRLRILNLYHNSLHDKGALAIAKMLEINTTLQVVDLESCKVEEEGLSSLAQSLVENSSLLALNLRGNFTHSSTMVQSALYSSLMLNKTLQEIGLNSLALSDDVISEIQQQNPKLLLRSFNIRKIEPIIPLHNHKFLQ